MPPEEMACLLGYIETLDRQWAKIAATVRAFGKSCANSKR
jgi:hypothetical protein